jgi:hypothetical protein
LLLLGLPKKLELRLKKAAEEAMNEALDQCETVLKPESLDEVGPPSISNGWR